MNSKDGTLLQLQRITKIYPNGLIANRDIDLMIKRGCVYVILGENGAGKTTLMNIIFGLISPTFGSILYKGKRIAFSSTADAIKAGIGMIHQHFKLVPVLSVLDNCFLGIEPKRFFLTDKRLMKSRLTQLLKEYEFNLPLDKPVSECSTHVRQILEIVKTLIRGAELIIMDEPTSLLAPQERAHLFNIIRSLKKSGKTIILITHKLTEALNIADTLIIMGEGKILQSFISHEENPKQHDLLELLFDNQPVHFNQIDQPCSQDEKLLEFNHINLCKNHHIQLHDLSFTLYKGEILGFAGMANSGQQEIIDIITGYEQDYTGDFRLFGMPPSHHTPLKARKAGITYIPSDRLQQGSDKHLTLWENLISTTLNTDSESHQLVLDQVKIMEHCRQLMKTFHIRAVNPSIQLNTLSGGNIQKVILARELSENAKIIVADNPTQGLDRHSMRTIQNLLKEERKKEKSILLFSQDMDELISLCDRIISLYEGRFIQVFERGCSLNAFQLGESILGSKEQMRS